MKKDELFIELYRRMGDVALAMDETDKVWAWLTKPLQAEGDSWAEGYKRHQEALEKAFQAIAQTRSAL